MASRFLAAVVVTVFFVGGSGVPHPESRARHAIADTAWTSIGPNNISGRMLSLALNPQNPSTLWAGSASGGVWRSFSAGLGDSAWHYVDTGHPVLGVSTIAFSPNDSSVVFIGTGEVYSDKNTHGGLVRRETRGHYGIGILKSTDAGISWKRVLSWERSQQRAVQMIRVDASDGARVWAATTEGLYRSLDGGETWKLVLDVRMATDVWIHPEDSDLLVVACGNLGTEGTGLYRSTDAGNAWTQIRNGLPDGYKGKAMLAGSPFDAEVLYASIGGGSGRNGEEATWLVKSEDAGATWTLISTFDYSRWQGWYSHFVAPDPIEPERLLVGGYELHVSKDSGATFRSLYKFERESSRSMYADQHAYVFHPSDPDIMYIANDGGIYRTEDGGSNFRSVSGGLQTTQFYNGTSSSDHDRNFFVGGLQDRCVAHFLGNPENWYTNRCDGAWTAIDPRGDAIYYVSHQYLAMYRRSRIGGPDVAIHPPCTMMESRNNGEYAAVAFISPFALAPSDPSRLYAACDKVYISNNRGSDWESTNDTLVLDGNPAISIAVSPSDANTVYVGTAPEMTRAGVFQTRDAGKTWTNISGSLPDRYPMDIAIHPEQPEVAWVTFGGFGSGRIYRTINAGASWEDFSGNLPDEPANAVFIDPLYPDQVYVGNDRGVYVNSGTNTTWLRLSDGLPTAVMVMDLSYSSVDRQLRVATHGNGVYQRPLPDPNQLVR